MPLSRRLIVGDIDGSPRSAVGEIQYTNGSTSITGGVATVTTGGVAGTVDTIELIINGAGSEIADGIAGDRFVPFNCTINSVTLLADQSGSIVVDIWYDTLANYPPTDADTITASAPPTITTDTDSQDATLTGWTTTLVADRTLRYNVDSCTTITRCSVILSVTRT